MCRQVGARPAPPLRQDDAVEPFRPRVQLYAAHTDGQASLELADRAGVRIDERPR
jgi:hypothetical protein